MNSKWTIVILKIRTRIASSFWVPVDPSCVSAFTGEWMLEDFVNCRVWLVLLLVHHDGDITGSSACSVEPGAVSPILGHGRVGIDSGLRGTPFDVATGPNGVVQISVSEDGTVQCIPGPTKRAFSRQCQ